MDLLQRFTAFADAYAALVRYVGVPDRLLRIDADAIGDAGP